MGNSTNLGSSGENQGILYVVATPIGNLEDISDRARHILSQVSRIAAEDTRRTKQLLSHIDVNTPCFSLHEHNERQKVDQIVQYLKNGESIALVSDAGTPLISDPGYPLVNALREQGLNVVAVPGPCALIAALSISGLPSDRFIFEGFLPSKSGARLSHLNQVAKETATLIFYESSHRIKASVTDMISAFGGDRKAVIAREITKTFETVLSGTLTELESILKSDPNQSKGEFVVLIQGAEKKQNELSEEVQLLANKLAEHLPGKTAAKIVAEVHGVKKNQVYQYLLDEN